MGRFCLLFSVWLLVLMPNGALCQSFGVENSHREFWQKLDISREVLAQANWLEELESLDFYFRRTHLGTLEIEIPTVPRNGIFEKIGFRSGDIIIGIRSQPITTFSQATLGVVGTLQSRSGSIVVLRNGGRVHLAIHRYGQVDTTDRQVLLNQSLYQRSRSILILLSIFFQYVTVDEFREKRDEFLKLAQESVESTSFDSHVTWSILRAISHIEFAIE